LLFLDYWDKITNRAQGEQWQELHRLHRRKVSMTPFVLLKRLSAAMSYAAALALVVFIFCAGNRASAQSVFGTIVGTVTDASGSAVPVANVRLNNTATNETKTVQSDANGNYTFVDLQPGTYSIGVEKEGFKKLTRSGIEVQVSSAIRVDAGLQVGDTQQTVDVTTETPLLQTQNATIGHEIEQKQVEELALNGRDVFNLIALAPGVVPQGSTMTSGTTVIAGASLQYQIGGGTAGQSAAYVDGAPVNVSYVNGNPIVPVQDSVQEFRVASSDVSPEFGRYGGGIVNITTKGGTNSFHGTMYEFMRNQDFNANGFFTNKAGLPRTKYQQNEYGATFGGPVKKDRSFFFLSWEQVDLRQAGTTTTTVPTAAMLQGNFSQAGIPQLYDPLSTALVNGVETRTPFAGNIIPASRINQTSVTMAHLMFAPPTNGGLTNNYVVGVPKVTDGNVWQARWDHRFGEKNMAFARYTQNNSNYSGSSNFFNTAGTGGKKGSENAVAGDTYTINATTFADFRASYLRSLSFTNPLSEGMNMCVFGPSWCQFNTQMTPGTQLPTPNIVPDNNFNGQPTINEIENIYTLSGSLTKIVGKHNLRFGAEARRIEWGYFQSNTDGTTYTFDAGFTQANPLNALSNSSGYGTASFLLGYPSNGSATEPDKNYGIEHYYGIWANDSWRATNKLTLTVGVRLEDPGSFTERYGSIETWVPNLPQTALSQATGLNLQGGLVLDGSQQRANKSWQNINYMWSPRIGAAYSLTNSTVIRAGYGIAALPNTVCFCLGPYNVPTNNAVSNMVTSLDGGLTPNPATTISNPFPTGLVTPSHSQAYINSLVGNGVDAPVAQQPGAYLETWSIGVQKQWGAGLMGDVTYMGGRGVHLPMYDLNTDQLPDQYLSMGSSLLTPVANPFYGVIPTSSTLGQKTIPQGYLLRPYPQYLYTSELGVDEGDSYYQSLQMKVQKRIKGGVLLATYTLAHLRSDVDVLDPWSEQNRYNVGGGEGVQDNTNIKGKNGEMSLSSFDVPRRAVFSYVTDLPFGQGQKYLSSTHGVVSKLVSGWGFSGTTIFQTGFPMALQDASPNTFENDFAIGNGGPGPPGAGVSRPNYTPGCNTAAPNGSTLQGRLSQWFNTSCFSAPGQFALGTEPRVDPNIRAQGVDNTDVALSKKTTIREGMMLTFRAEAFNVFNRVQFQAAGSQFGASTFGVVSAQTNQPRLIQLSLRLSF
jgi:hypothetical protein